MKSYMPKFQQQSHVRVHLPQQLTGFGGHVIIANGGKGFVEGVELCKMGQTNVLGMHAKMHDRTHPL